jgi:hypothetical protein
MVLHAIARRFDQQAYFISRTTITMISATVKLLSMITYTGTVHVSGFAMVAAPAAGVPGTGAEDRARFARARPDRRIRRTACVGWPAAVGTRVDGLPDNADAR